MPVKSGGMGAPNCAKTGCEVNAARKIKPDAIPEYWLARQRELAEAREAGADQQGTVGTMTREEAEQALGGVFGLDEG